MAISKLKGTYDVLPYEAEKWTRLEQILRNICRLYDYKEIRTPIFEQSDLYHRSIDETSDIVKKETYTFKDRGNRDITLRPEGTAGIVRSFIENKMYADGHVQKLFYMGPHFRYERPQKGRFRQFSQFGVEALGSSSPALDAEVIALAATIIRAVGLKNIIVKLNTLGDDTSRQYYRDALTKHFEPYTSELCQDCQVRLIKNPLRVLDCKIDRDHEAFKNAPKTMDYLTPDANLHYNKVRQHLQAMGIAYQEDPMLVRGLDYYTHTVFEVEATIEGFGAQTALAAGGRYDKLVETLGGPSIPGTGFAFGLERLLLAIEAEGKPLSKDTGIHLYILGLGETVSEEVSKLVQTCRVAGLITECDYQKKGFKQQFKHADRLKASYIAIIGDDELKSGTINVKDTATGEQVVIRRDDLVRYVVHSIEHQKANKSHCGHCIEDNKES